MKLSLEGKGFEASSAILQAFEFKENLKLQQFMKLACILCTCTLAIFSQLRGKVLQFLLYVYLITFPFLIESLYVFVDASGFFDSVEV